MRRFLSVLLVAGMLLLMVVPAFSAPPTYARRGLTFTPVTTNTAMVLPAGTWVYGIGIYASTGATAMGLYDVATLPEATDANLSAPEVGEATQYASNFIWYPRPIYFSTGVTAVRGTGIGSIASGPQP